MGQEQNDAGKQVRATFQKHKGSRTEPCLFYRASFLLATIHEDWKGSLAMAAGSQRPASAGKETLGYSVFGSYVLEQMRTSLLDEEQPIRD